MWPNKLYLWLFVHQMVLQHQEVNKPANARVQWNLWSKFDEAIYWIKKWAIEITFEAVGGNPPTWQQIFIKCTGWVIPVSGDVSPGTTKCFHSAWKLLSPVAEETKIENSNNESKRRVVPNHKNLIQSKWNYRLIIHF